MQWELQRSKASALAAIAQLGERQTEDLKVPGSIPGLGTFLAPASTLCEPTMPQNQNQMELSCKLKCDWREETLSDLSGGNGAQGVLNGLSHLNGTSGLVAMTSASHAEGRQFDPGLVYFDASSEFET